MKVYRITLASGETVVAMSNPARPAWIREMETADLKDFVEGNLDGGKLIRFKRPGENRKLAGMVAELESRGWRFPPKFDNEEGNYRWSRRR